MFRNLRISTKLLLTVLPLILLGVGLSAYVTSQHQEELMLEQARVAA